MLNQIKLVLLALIGSLMVPAQVSLGGFMKDKANEAKDKAKSKVREKTTESWEKKRLEYDESNFNYAISFLDNSGVFEADEKGNAFTGTALNSVKFLNREGKSVEERAYTNLKNGEILMAGNQYNMAEQSFRLSKVLYEESSQTTNTNYAQTISDLGLLYQSRGLYSKAKKYNEQALELREKGDNKGMLIVSLNNNAVLKKETGYYTEAEKELLKALNLARENKDTMAIALITNNLAMTYLDMNKLKDAEKNMLMSVTEASGILKENSSNLIKLKINLANIYRLQKKYTEAEDIYKKAIEVKEKKLGTHPDLAHLKKGLAQLYMEMNRPEEVEKLLLSAYDINKKKLGENNPATVSTQQELANFYRFSNKPAKSVELMVKVVEKKKIIYGEGHPNYIQALEDLSLAQWQNNKIAEAKAGYKTVIDNTLNYINTFFTSLNDNEKTLYWDKTNTRLQRFFNFAFENIKSDPDLLTQLYTTCINTKGFLLNNSSKIRNIISSSNDEDLKATYQKWLEAKENLNAAYQLSKEELAQEKINVDSLNAVAGELEKELSQKSSAFRDGSGGAVITPEEIQAQLKTGEAAVEIIELNEFKNGFTGNANYIAVVVKPDGLKLVSLGDDAAIARAVSDFRVKTISQKPENEAYALTWKPLDEELKGITSIYLSLDGIYHQLSINALKDASGKYLADRYSIQFVGNTKDLISVKQNELASVKPLSAFLIGNPLYGHNDVIAQLPGTEAEVKNITKLLSTYKVKATALYGKDATEEQVKKVNSPGILHIATHGYFLTDVSQIESKKVLGVDINAAKENPLLRSGVLLAGCENVFDPEYHAPHNSENGVLTAYEAMSLNLDKTDLVVLSACETGLGSVRQGEGVYGLQRAFLIAGTKSIIMSLWSVSDEGTMELMTLFYTNYAKSGNKQKAFSDAIKQLKVKYKEPFYWGAFVMLSK
ncbi:MAG: CHAT domain-containing protein [Bacteroidetes bacterium]|nr:CHAT domain-containing protein [Bacteroidota bacterium]